MTLVPGKMINLWSNKWSFLIYFSRCNAGILAYFMQNFAYFAEKHRHYAFQHLKYIEIEGRGF